jgi:glycosyltransferase involved in cell wall biosynthesis
VRRECIELYEVPDEKVVVISNGYDNKVFKPRQLSKEKIFQNHGIDADVSLPVVTFGGKMSKTKGVDILLEANALAQKKRPFTLLLFGSGDLKNLLAKAPAKDEKRNAIFIGHVPQDVLAQFHSIAEFSVLPSREEGFAIAALEAMGCGLPVVATEIPSLKELIVGRTVPVEDPEALADAMVSLLNLPEEKKRILREKSIEKAHGYSWEQNTEKRLDYYNAAISRGLFR